MEKIGQQKDSQLPIQLPASTEIADMRGPYVPLVGAVVVPFPAQKKRIIKTLFVTFALYSLTTALSTPGAAFSTSKSFNTSFSCTKLTQLTPIL